MCMHSYLDEGSNIFRIFFCVQTLKEADITMNIGNYCPARVTVTSCFVYKVIRDLESVDHLCINPIRRIS